MRSVKTDFVSCPSCGRTLFDLQEVTEQIKKKTGHLPGVAIAIMVSVSQDLTLQYRHDEKIIFLLSIFISFL